MPPEPQAAKKPEAQHPKTPWAVKGWVIHDQGIQFPGGFGVKSSMNARGLSGPGEMRIIPELSAILHTYEARGPDGKMMKHRVLVPLQRLSVVELYDE